MPIKLPQFLKKHLEKPPESNLENNVSELYSEDTPNESPIAFQVLIIIFCVGYILLSIVNLIFDSEIKTLSNTESDLISQVASLESDRVSILEAARKIDYYKTSSQNRVSISDKTAFIFSKIVPELELLDVSIKPGNFSITLKGANAFVFTKLISDYLKDSYVSEVSLKSASFNPTSNSYTVDLEGILK